MANTLQLRIIRFFECVGIFLNRRLNFPFGKTSTLQKINSPNEIKKVLMKFGQKRINQKEVYIRKILIGGNGDIINVRKNMIFLRYFQKKAF